jgi:hypothetical protein
MSETAKKTRDLVRIQFDVRKAHLEMIDNLVEACGLSSKKELFNNSMALMKWAVEETRKGRRIASYDVDHDKVELVALPALDLVDAKASQEDNRRKSLRSVEQDTNSTSDRRNKNMSIA